MKIPPGSKVKEGLGLDEDEGELLLRLVVGKIMEYQKYAGWYKDRPRGQAQYTRWKNKESQWHSILVAIADNPEKAIDMGYARKEFQSWTSKVRSNKV